MSSDIWHRKATPDERRRVMVFARCPDPGRCKTRLIPVLGTEGATSLYESLVKRTMGSVAAVLDTGCDVEVLFAGENFPRLREICGPVTERVTFRRQSEGDLGDRLAAAFDTAFQEGFSRVIAIGTDCPQLSAETVAAAFNQLDEDDVVLGPAVDGGYYLVAVGRHLPQLFHKIPWGGPSVLETTTDRAASTGLTVGLLSPLDDVDRPADLGLCRELGLLLRANLRTH